MIDIKNIDYKEVGLACGLEIHQQLDTNKLFCNCKSIIIKDDTEPDKIIKRKLFARSSESGEKDFSADVEQKKNKTFVYCFYNSCNCLVETDSQPPFEINKDALNIAMVVSLLTNSSFVDAGHIMRKQVIDGSNVSGFQKTMMVSTGGHLDFDFGKVRINKILLEEDSARPIKKTDTESYFSLDRQGTPLIELVVWHDIHFPEDARKVALNIGQLFRRTCKTKRGLGSIRQDVNISIKGGARVEIKGTQDLDLIPEVVKREVVRQLSLIDVKKKLKSIKPTTLSFVDISNIFKDSSSSVILKAINNKQRVYGCKIDNFKGILGTEIQPNRRVGTEIAGVLKAQTNIKGIIHLDELPNYGLENKDIILIKEKLDVKDKDSFILVTCYSLEIEYVKEIIQKRLNQLFLGVPEETRIVTPEGNTQYQRPLSSGARMYPETDLKPIVFDKQLINFAKRTLPKTVEDRLKLYTKEYNLNKQLADKMVLNNYAVLFEDVLNQVNINSTTLAVFLLEDLKSILRDRLLSEEEVTEEKLKEFFTDNAFIKIPKSKLVDVFVYFIKNDCSVGESLKDLDLLASSDIDVDKILDKIIEDNKDFIIKQKERAINFVMGQLMKQTKGLVDTKEAAIISKNKIVSFLKNI
jgi:glutamyl-tRNA(Gln) amidotransferase subunit E